VGRDGVLGNGRGLEMEGGQEMEMGKRRRGQAENLEAEKN
jgi:hypothetical protein